MSPFPYLEVQSIKTLKTNDLSFYNEFGVLTLNAKQFDTGRIFIFNIIDNDEPFDLSGYEVYLRIAKADGTQFQGHGCCSTDEASITVNTGIGNGNQILTAAGINKCELHLKDRDGITLTTWTFNIYVEKRVHDGSNISSINSYDVLDNMIDSEKERIKNEQIRISNESKRIQNEDQRILDEIKRQENESERQKTFTSVLEESKSYVHTASTHANYAKESETKAAKSEENAFNSALESESWAHGGTGLREDENINNAENWCNKSKESSEKAETLLKDATDLLEKTNQNIIATEFEVSDDGEIFYTSEIYDFNINDNGELEWSVVL